MYFSCSSFLCNFCFPPDYVILETELKCRVRDISRLSTCKTPEPKAHKRRDKTQTREALQPRDTLNTIFNLLNTDSKRIQKPRPPLQASYESPRNNRKLTLAPNFTPRENRHEGAEQAFETTNTNARD